jgi:GNAT superfamily N-acetyltransferase
MNADHAILDMDEDDIEFVLELSRKGFLADTDAAYYEQFFRLDDETRNSTGIVLLTILNESDGFAGYFVGYPFPVAAPDRRNFQSRSTALFGETSVAEEGRGYGRALHEEALRRYSEQGFTQLMAYFEPAQLGRVQKLGRRALEENHGWVWLETVPEINVDMATMLISVPAKGKYSRMWVESAPHGPIGVPFALGSSEDENRENAERALVQYFAANTGTVELDPNVRAFVNNHPRT